MIQFAFFSKLIIAEKAFSGKQKPSRPDFLLAGKGINGLLGFALHHFYNRAGTEPGPYIEWLVKNQCAATFHDLIKGGMGRGANRQHCFYRAGGEMVYLYFCELYNIRKAEILAAAPFKPLCRGGSRTARDNTEIP
jgi:hypothetical protein